MNGEADQTQSLELTEAERWATNLEWALGPHFMGPTDRAGYVERHPDAGWDEAEDVARYNKLAIRLGFADEIELERESARLSAAIRDGAPLTFADWKTVIRLMSRLMSPDDSEWQTVVGLTYLETAAALVAVNRKLDLAFGGTRVNPMTDGSFQH